ncbi:class I SAM-dependent methyltransferase [Streptomyces sp. B1866]|nr:class I SAM-dependent methyltransferase [Streptomyces sp. B1866]MDT3397407.1 class I SAM-dependent methyltransferase [Streptomyces sp. B1866]
MADDGYAGASATAIRGHYDVGDDFYALWLDPTLTYSCALWETGEESLEAAQARKADYLAEAARARVAGRVLDVGCGWGGSSSGTVCGGRRA